MSALLDAINSSANPHFTIGCLLLLLASVGLLLGYVGSALYGPKRTTVQRVEVVPPHLSRLAQVLGVKTDAPASQSYGRMVHDLFEEKDLEIRALRAEIRTQEEEAEERLRAIESAITTRAKELEARFATNDRAAPRTYSQRVSPRVEFRRAGLTYCSLHDLAEELSPEELRVISRLVPVTSNVRGDYYVSLSGDLYRVHDTQPGTTFFASRSPLIARTTGMARGVYYKRGPEPHEGRA